METVNKNQEEQLERLGVLNVTAKSQNEMLKVVCTRQDRMVQMMGEMKLMLAQLTGSKTDGKEKPVEGNVQGKGSGRSVLIDNGNEEINCLGMELGQNTHEGSLLTLSDHERSIEVDGVQKVRNSELSLSFNSHTEVNSNVVIGIEENKIIRHCSPSAFETERDIMIENGESNECIKNNDMQKNVLGERVVENSKNCKSKKVSESNAVKVMEGEKAHLIGSGEGRLDQVYVIVRDTTVFGLGLNNFCYAGIMIAHKNQMPLPDDTVSKIIELVEQFREWSSVEQTKDNAGNIILGNSEEELYIPPTAEYIHHCGGFTSGQLAVYHVTFHAYADLRKVEATERLLEMLKKDGKFLDVFILVQVMKHNLHVRDIDCGPKFFEGCMKSNDPPMIELYVTLTEGVHVCTLPSLDSIRQPNQLHCDVLIHLMVGYTPKEVQLAQETPVNLNSRSCILNVRMGDDLLIAASGGQYVTLHYLLNPRVVKRMRQLLTYKEDIPTLNLEDKVNLRGRDVMNWAIYIYYLVGL